MSWKRRWNRNSVLSRKQRVGGFEVNQAQFTICFPHAALRLCLFTPERWLLTGPWRWWEKNMLWAACWVWKCRPVVWGKHRPQKSLAFAAYAWPRLPPAKPDRQEIQFPSDNIWIKRWLVFPNLFHWMASWFCSSVVPLTGSTKETVRWGEF